jgi:endoglucanase
VSDHAHSAIPLDRLARLNRCVNVSRWFRYPSGPTRDHFFTFITDADLDLMTRLGVTGVRLTIGAEQIIAKDLDDRPIIETVDCLKVAIARLASRGLATVVAMYGVSDRVESPFRARDFVSFWGRLAWELGATDPALVFFEPVNEPIFSLLPQRWRGVEAKLASAVRSAAPHHTIVTSGTNWSSLDSLLAHRPLDDPNVLYTFHFYEPYLFTHQGAPWNSGWTTDVRDVPYPLTHDAVTARLDPASPHFRSVVREAATCYDAACVDRRIRAAAEWAARHGVPVWVGEFGCYPRVAPRECVLDWFRDVRTAMERHGIGWAVWSYDEELGLDRKLVDGRPVIDSGVAMALGFPPPPAEPMIV